MKPKIYYEKPSITQKELSYVTDAASNNWGDNHRIYIERFEETFKKHLGVNYAITTSSCTGSLHMGMAALGIGPGDEVIMADTNWIASAAPTTYLGAKPIFVDILPDTWCIDPVEVEKSITPNTKAIIAVHLYGNLCEMDELVALGEKYGVPIIEDAAQAVGSSYHEKQAGSIGKFGVFSFHGSKTIAMGEGGMFVTNDQELYELVSTLSNHGRSRNQTKQFWPDMVGFKYKMTNLQAAMGCAQVERIDDILRRKREIFHNYDERLYQIDGIQMNPEKKGTINSYWKPTIVFSKKSGVTREHLLAAFEAENIDARIFFWPLSSLNMFEDCPSNTNSYDICGRAINLPSYYDLCDEDINRVVGVINEVCI
jgi:perosamine synthetase